MAKCLGHQGTACMLSTSLEMKVCKARLLLQGHGYDMNRAWASYVYMCVCVSHSVMSDSLQTPWTLAYQTPLFMEFSRQEYWSGLPFPSPWDHPDSGIKPRSPALMADSLPSKPVGKPNICIQTHTP